MNRLKVLTNGLIKENPVLVLLLGTCPTLATSRTVIDAVSMGIAATFVLIGSNVVISMLKRIIPDKVRIPCYIVVIAGFVTIVQLLVKAFFPDIYSALGVFLPLIVVNCIILGRAEMFANQNTVFDSFLDGVGMGLGFTFALFVMSTIRELIGQGTLLNFPITVNFIEPFSIISKPPGGFFIFGVVIAAVTWLTKGRTAQKSACAGCPSAAMCAGAEAAAEGEGK